jgi:hypothetical protein
MTYEEFKRRYDDVRPEERGNFLKAHKKTFTVYYSEKSLSLMLDMEGREDIFISSLWTSRKPISLILDYWETFADHIEKGNIAIRWKGAK